jgi:poly(3-hydroxyalkanoate) synthetase
MANNTLLSIRLMPEPLRILLYTGISDDYAAIGDPLAYPARMVLFQNVTDVLVRFSFDGVNDHLVLPPNGFLILDVTGNKSLAQGFFIMQGTTFYVITAGTPSLGAVYISSFYGAD